MYNQPVETYVGTSSILVDDGAQLVYWIIVEPTSVHAAGTLLIYDGVSDKGKVVARIKTAYTRIFPFFPPIRCSVGLYISIGSVIAIASYTVGFLAEGTVKKQQFPIGS